MITKAFITEHTNYNIITAHGRLFRLTTRTIHIYETYFIFFPLTGIYNNECKTVESKKDLDTCASFSYRTCLYRQKIGIVSKFSI